ncbi:high frequency lysogenization protein HflD [Litorilituus lipolyticus]|uniref:High frequency lysogenization protein HflD homolog n=1 Tax=Litorilituus lipolyticus TaxID=2491017 RepID=A0A502KML5_9GAMM|nr:high frequency lysogenization protein HflD [Litorilituus lipolyticus]TPH12908.1 lysogenization regulator HflD [Litorilituus lipolyticus]
MKDQIITLAALCQVANLVQQVSRKGQADESELEMLLNSIVETSPQNTLAVYGGELSKIRAGLILLIEHLGDNKNDKVKDPEFTRYLISLMNLERKLVKQPKKLALLSERIEDTKRQLTHYELTSDPLVASFASIYSDIISPLGAKIQVTGEPNILKQKTNQYRIRALLLAGIRTAVLWRQVGGKRRTILFSRTKLVQLAKQLLASLD